MKLRRLSLRMAFLGLTILAILLGRWASIARDQRQLLDNGVCVDRRVHWWIPNQLRSFLSDDFSSYVTHIRVGGMIAPTKFSLSFNGRKIAAEGVDPNRLSQILRLRGMRHIDTLEFLGTAVSDEWLLANMDKLKTFRSLRSIRFSMTAVTEPCAEKVGTVLPACKVDYSGNWPGHIANLDNGRFVEFIHRDALRVTKDLGLFRRAAEGEPGAVRDLLVAAARQQPGDWFVALESLGKATTPAAKAVLLDCLSDQDALVRELTVKALEIQRDFEAISRVCDDPVADVRLQCQRSLARIDRQRALDAIIKGTRDSDTRIRWQAVDFLQKVKANRRALDALLVTVTDDDSTVRAATARVLGNYDDPLSIAVLEHALQDDDRFVRQNAEAALHGLRVSVRSKISAGGR
jgi:hypothetical protein